MYFNVPTPWEIIKYLMIVVGIAAYFIALLVCWIVQIVGDERKKRINPDQPKAFEVIEKDGRY